METQAIETVAKGELIQLVRTYTIAGVKTVQPTQKFYRVAGYCRTNRAYMVDDPDDISRDRALRKGTPVIVGGTY